jgi:hypothetical protein
MGLTDEQARGFWPAYREYREQMARVGDRLLDVIEEFVEAEASLTDEQATRLLDEFLAAKAQEVSVRRKHARKFRKLLPPSLVLRFFQLENKLDAVVNYELAESVPLAR